MEKLIIAMLAAKPWRLIMIAVIMVLYLACKS